VYSKLKYEAGVCAIPTLLPCLKTLCKTQYLDCNQRLQPKSSVLRKSSVALCEKPVM
jgi:hypothetical protein